MIKKKLLIIVPARGNSQGIKNKNIRLINGKPLLYYSLNTARKLKINDKIIFCSTDSKKIQNICKKFNFKPSFLRPKKIATSLSRDIEYVNHALKKFNELGFKFKFGLILRPTSPKRNTKVILRAFNQFVKGNFDSMRAIIEAPYPVDKMWYIKKNILVPIIKSTIYENYNAPRQILKKSYAQSGNFEFFKVNYKIKLHSISQKKIGYFLTSKNLENDIDTLKELKNLKL
ncbi:acylneuraminate cytidylyltransferase family protein [Pelagibacterales bacterium SAG-MED23]|nr:acylneuraminate cytidylyltransferase family protein [Pelagibacterales bacterium SAG-MED23]